MGYRILRDLSLCRGCECRPQTAQVQHLSCSERLVFGSTSLLRVAKRLRHAASLCVGRLDRATAAGTSSPCLKRAHLHLLPPLASSGEQPGRRIQEPRISKQPGTRTQVQYSVFSGFGVSVVVWCFLANSQGRNPNTGRGNGPCRYFTQPYGLFSLRCWCHGVLVTSHHQRRMLQLPVMRDLVARHLWAVRTISPLKRSASRPMHKCLHQSLAGGGCMGN